MLLEFEYNKYVIVVFQHNQSDYQKLIHGKNQKGIFLLSKYLKYKRYGKLVLNHDEYFLSEELPKDGNKLFFLDSIMKNLTRDEIVELLTSKTNPLFLEQNIYLFDNDFFEKKIYELLINEEERRLFFINNLKIKYFYKFESFQKQIRNFASSLEIFEKFKHDMYFKESIFYGNFDYFIKYWNIFVNITDIEHQKLILKEKILDNNEHYYISKHFDPCLNILQLTLLSNRIFRNMSAIYEEYFNKTEIQRIILSSDTFLPDLIVDNINESCKKIIEYFLYIYFENENLLLEFLLANVYGSKMNVFEYLKDLPGPKSCYNELLKLKENLENTVTN